MRYSHARTIAQLITDAEKLASSQTIAKPNVIRRPLSIEDFKDGFKYEAWVGYEWAEVEYGKNGFSKSQLKDASGKAIW